MTPKTTIVITTFLEKNKRVLDLAIESINNLNYPKDSLEVILVGKKSYKPEYPGVKTVAPDSDDFYNPEGLNFGFRHASPDSEYFLMLNDDVILTKDSLLRLINAEKVKHPCVVNAISPCDNFWGIYDLLIGYQKPNSDPVFFNKQFFNYEELNPIKHELMNATSFYPFGLLNVPFLCMFATLIPRSVWERVGEFDENFKTGQDDIDWCYRAQKSGVRLQIALDVVIWHFGGVTSSETIRNDLRVENVEYFVSKYGSLPPFVTQQSLEDMRNDRVRFKRD